MELCLWVRDSNGAVQRLAQGLTTPCTDWWKPQEFAFFMRPVDIHDVITLLCNAKEVMLCEDGDSGLYSEKGLLAAHKLIYEHLSRKLTALVVG